MGFYINPKGESKESFLKREGSVVPNNFKITWKSVPKGYLPVILVNNGPFTAAAIAYCAEELEVFTDLNDPRPRILFMVKIEKIIEVAPDFEQYAKSNGLIQ